ncbi:transcriptional regulator [Mesorhizobium microcysteis]|uniref:Transcriptional regulator n=1 Tax=Neoaquamicrobium microcysteis TaxID=2682781 RepID=A0A5D4GT86_9HYPH|nr:transcriptional regulator [Mesorhizobium microcysteis]
MTGGSPSADRPEKAALHPVPTVLVVVPDPELRRSVEFALEAEGYRVDSYATLGAAFAAPGPFGAGCAVVDENAISGRRGAATRLDGLGGPVILLADRMRTVPHAAGLTVLTKPLLGRLLVETVDEIVASLDVARPAT